MLITSAKPVPLQSWGDQGDGTFCNPLIWADYNNPWLMQHGNDFYMIAASHHFMGMPLLHSRDLVNWRLLTQVYHRLDYDELYNHPGQAYQRGSWAPALVFHDSRFMMYCMNSTDGWFLTSAQDPAGPWDPVQLLHPAVHWEDPFPFWDDDGQAYLFRSGFGGHAPVTVHRMSSDGRRLLDQGCVLEETMPNAHNPLVLKRDGYYYLFATRSGIQMVFRSRQIYGPYEQRVVLDAQGVGPSPGGGGWVELPNGECWFMHHVGIPGHGRLPFLQPAGWKDGWPWMGANLNAQGTGGIAWRSRKPRTSQADLAVSLVQVDDFNAVALSPDWRWNHNPRPEGWSLSEHPGFLRLKADLPEAGPGVDGVHLPVEAADDSVIFASNTLARLMVGKTCQAEVCLDTASMADGQRAGLCLFNQDFLWIGVVREMGVRRLRAVDCQGFVEGPALLRDQVFLRASNQDGVGEVAYSLDGESFSPLGRSIPLKIQWFEAHKFSLFTYNTRARAGAADFSNFRLESLK
jgi:beta-xylosidase